jgi:hypothetical protein
MGDRLDLLGMKVRSCEHCSHGAGDGGVNPGDIRAFGCHWRENQMHHALWRFHPFDRAVFISRPVDELGIPESLRRSTK